MSTFPPLAPDGAPLPAALEPPHGAAPASEDRAAAPPLAGLVVLGAEPRAARRLSGWGATCLATAEPEALRGALAAPGVRALCRIGPADLPIRPPEEIAAALLDGRDHVGEAATGWCLSADTARRLLEGTAGAEGPAGTAAVRQAAVQAGRPAGAPVIHARPDRAVLGLADLPAAFGSGRPFAGPFEPAASPAAIDRALAATETRPRRERSPRLPDGLAPLGAAPAPRPGEILAVIVARDEALRLPDALATAKALGVDRAIVIDNRSGDGTRTAAEAAGAHLIDAPGSYAGSQFGITWTNAVLDAWGRGHWALVIDADEQLVFPGSDRVGLPALTAHLDALGAEALRTVLLDCFPPGPLAACAYQPGEPLIEAAPFFEPPQLRREAIEDFPHTLDYGGARERLFFPEADPRRLTRRLRQKAFNLGLRVPGLRDLAAFRRLAPPRSPTVTKLPLLRWREGAALLASTHRVAPMRLAATQPSGVLLHFKFLQDFHARALDAVARQAHYDGSREYRRYLARLEAEPGFAPAGPDCLRYAGPGQLVALGLMQDTPGWAAARAGG